MNKLVFASILFIAGGLYAQDKKDPIADCPFHGKKEKKTHAKAKELLAKAGLASHSFV